MRSAGRLFALVLVFVSMATAVRASPHEGALCTGAIRTAERAYGLPAGLLMAVALTETGRRVDGVLTPWPWSINARGDGIWFEDRTAALRHVRGLRDRGVRSIDVGCMQINLKWHDAAFNSLDRAFDPDANVRYAARHIKSLRARSRDWLEAAGRYHSWDAARADAYLERLSVNWQAVREGTQRRTIALPRAPGRIDLRFEFTPAGESGASFVPLREPGRGGGRLLGRARPPLLDLLPAPGGIWGHR